MVEVPQMGQLMNQDCLEDPPGNVPQTVGHSDIPRQTACRGEPASLVRNPAHRARLNAVGEIAAVELLGEGSEFVVAAGSQRPAALGTFQKTSDAVEVCCNIETLRNSELPAVGGRLQRVCFLSARRAHHSHFSAAKHSLNICRRHGANPSRAPHREQSEANMSRM